MPAKMARSAPRPPFGLPKVMVAVRTSRLSCWKAGKARIFTPVREFIRGIRSREAGSMWPNTARPATCQGHDEEARQARWRPAHGKEGPGINDVAERLSCFTSDTCVPVRLPSCWSSSAT